MDRSSCVLLPMPVLVILHPPSEWSQEGPRGRCRPLFPLEAAGARDRLQDGNLRHGVSLMIQPRHVTLVNNVPPSLLWRLDVLAQSLSWISSANRGVWSVMKWITQCTDTRGSFPPQCEAGAGWPVTGEGHLLLEADTWGEWVSHSRPYSGNNI